MMAQAAAAGRTLAQRLEARVLELREAA
eukprot:SAG25_NODE_9012_length_392_cov_0.846416_1_plen_27_part_10